MNESRQNQKSDGNLKPKTASVQRNEDWNKEPTTVESAEGGGSEFPSHTYGPQQAEERNHVLRTTWNVHRISVDP